MKEKSKNKVEKFDKTTFPLEFRTLEFRNVSFAYPQAKEEILHNFSFTFKKGDFYKLNGVSGRGKSTLLKLITGQLKPSRGKILLNGVDINAIPRGIINSLIVYMPQAVTIFPRSIDYNILLGRNYNEKTLDLVKKDFNISDEWQFDSLSGGQEQRVALARLIDTKGKIILLDESFSSIDLKTAQELLQQLLKRVETVIVVSHRNEEIAQFNFKILSLD